MNEEPVMYMTEYKENFLKNNLKSLEEFLEKES